MESLTAIEVICRFLLTIRASHRLISLTPSFGQRREGNSRSTLLFTSLVFWISKSLGSLWPEEKKWKFHSLDFFSCSLRIFSPPSPSCSFFFFFLREMSLSLFFLDSKNSSFSFFFFLKEKSFFLDGVDLLGTYVLLKMGCARIEGVRYSMHASSRSKT